MSLLIDDLNDFRRRAKEPWAGPIATKIKQEAASFKYLDGADLVDWPKASLVPRWAWDSRSDEIERIGRNRDVFIIAMGCVRRSQRIRRELFTMAAAVLDSNNAQLREACLRYLRAPLQFRRWQYPGWTQYYKEKTMPADGDGEWGATENYLVVLPICAEFLSEWLTDNDWQLLRRRVAEHCSRIEDDFYTGRSWFFGGPNGGVPAGNQFTQLIGGLGVGALALLGHDPRASRWLELAVTQMLRSMDATGTDGSYYEGSSYGLGTMEQVTMLAHLLERTGERRLIEHPQVKNFPYWLVDTMVNDYDHWLPLNDSGGSLSHEPLYNRMRNWAGRVMALAAACTRDPVLNWYLHEVVGGPSHDVFGLLYYVPGFPQKRPKAERALRGMRPPAGWINSLPAGANIPHGDETDASGADRLAVHYPMQGIVVVRTGFAQEDKLLVLKGGWNSPGHDHLDRNSVLFYDGPVPVITEAGPGPYSDPDFDRHFGSYHAHSTLVLDGKMPGHQEKRYMCAHEGVERLPDGTVRMIGEAAGSYNSLARYRRIVDARLPACITITDEVIPSDAKEHEVTFWFHTPQAARFEDGNVVIPGQKGFWLLAIGQGNLKWTREQLGGKGSENRAAFAARGALPQEGDTYVFTIVPDSH